MTPAKNLSHRYDAHGRWHPPKRLGENQLKTRSQNYAQYWGCNGVTIQNVDPTNIPQQGLQHFRTVSAYHFDDIIDLVEYDATRYPVGDAATSSSGPVREDWQRMRFRHLNNTASFVGNFEANNRLFRQRANQAWARQLLPRGCWAPTIENTTDPTVGGMNGLLPLLIALVLMSYPSGYERQVLQTRFNNGRWILNDNQQACERHVPTFQVLHTDSATLGLDTRGLVVEVWTWPGQSTRESLAAFENGQRGRIFN